MTNDSASRARQTNVKLETVAAVDEGKIERSESVLGNGSRRTCPTMTKKQGKGGHCALLYADLLSYYWCSLIKFCIGKGACAKSGTLNMTPSRQYDPRR